MSSPTSSSSSVSGSSLSQPMITELKQEKSELEMKVNKLTEQWDILDSKGMQGSPALTKINQEIASSQKRINEIAKVLGVYDISSEQSMKKFSSALMSLREVLKSGKAISLGTVATSLGYIDRSMVPRASNDTYSSLLENIKKFQTLVESDPSSKELGTIGLAIYEAVEFPSTSSTTEVYTPELFLRFMRTLDALTDFGFYQGKPNINDLKQGSLSDADYQTLAKDITEFLTLLDKKGQVSPVELTRAQVLSDEIHRIIGR